MLESNSPQPRPRAATISCSESAACDIGTPNSRPSSVARPMSLRESRSAKLGGSQCWANTVSTRRWLRKCPCPNAPSCNTRCMTCGSTPALAASVRPSAIAIREEIEVMLCTSFATMPLPMPPM